MIGSPEHTFRRPWRASINRLTDPQQIPPHLFDEANAYLDSKLGETQRTLFEERLRSDILTRRALIDALTLRSMVDMVFERGRTTPPVICDCVRGLIPDYLQCRLSADEQGSLSRHLDECETCREVFAMIAKAQQSTRHSRRRTLAAVLAMLVALTSITAFVFFGNRDAPDRVPPPRSDGLPLEEADLAVLRPIIRKTRSKSDMDRIDEAVGVVLRRAPNMFDDLRSRPTIKDLLRELHLVDVSVPEQFRVILLLAYAHETRLSPRDRGWALNLVSRMAGVNARGFLLRTAETSDEDELVASAITALARQELANSHQDRIEKLLANAVSRGWAHTVEAVLKTLCRAGVSLPAIEFLSGRLGTKWSAKMCRSIAREVPVNSSLPRHFSAQLESVALRGRFDRGSTAALCVLTARDPDANWGTLLRRHWNHSDSGVRWLVAKYLQFAATKADKELLDRMKDDEDAAVKRAIAKARSRLR